MNIKKLILVSGVIPAVLLCGCTGNGSDTDATSDSSDAAAVTETETSISEDNIPKTKRAALTAPDKFQIDPAYTKPKAPKISIITKKRRNIEKDLEKIFKDRDLHRD